MEASALLHTSSAVTAPTGARRAVTVWLAVGLISSLVILLALHHPYWVRGGDGDVYLGLGRSIATGEGYRFNGQPISLVPPLWPVVLAGAMKTSSSLAMLKLMQIAWLLLGFCAYYFVLLRLLSPGVACVTLVAVTFLPNVHELGFSFLAEPMFFALFGMALLLGMQINEGQPVVWRTVLLCMLCIAIVGVRWAGLIMWIVIGTALLSGELRPRLNARWLPAVLSGVSAAGAFFFLRWYLQVDPADIDLRFDATLSTSYAAINSTSWDLYIKRILSGGRWMSGLFCPAVMGFAFLGPLPDILGWSALLLVFIAAWYSARRRRWLFAGVLLYVGMLILNWPAAVPRYLMPLAPLLVAGMLEGAFRCREVFNPQLGRVVATVLPWLILLSIFACSVPLWWIEMRIARSSKFPARVFAGTDRQLVAAAEFLRARNVQDGEVAVSRAQMNWDRLSFTNGWMRAVHVLCGGPAIIAVPSTRSRPPDVQVMRWLRSKGVKYYLYRTPQRIDWTHFSSPPRLKRGMPEPQEWELYDVSGLKPRQIILPRDVQWPTHVPGLETSWFVCRN